MFSHLRGQLPGLNARQSRFCSCLLSSRGINAVALSVAAARLRSFSSSTAAGGGKSGVGVGRVDASIADFLSQCNLTGSENATEQQTRALHLKMVQTLENVYGKNKLKVSHLQSFGEAGLKALAFSLQQEEATKTSHESDKIVTVRFAVPHHRTEFDMSWHYSSHQPTLLSLVESPEGAELLSEYVEASCGGNASCSTCHVYVDRLAEGVQLSNISEAELDMLDLAYAPIPDRSRLACQVRLLHVAAHPSDDKPLLTVTIPPGVNNLWN